MPLPLWGPGHAHIEVVRRPGEATSKRLSSLDAEISFVLVPDLAQASNGLLQPSPLHKDIHVDDWLRGEAWHCRAANMLDAESYFPQGVSDTLTNQFVTAWP